jgi:hypothetical protein
MHRTLGTVAAFAVTMVLFVACGRVPQKPAETPEAISVYGNAADLGPVLGTLVIDFENQPFNGSSNCRPGDFCTVIDNPLVLEGVSFTDPSALRTGSCSSPTCTPDPDNPEGDANIVLVLNPGGTIDFPANTRRAGMRIEGIGDNPFQIEITDAKGNTKRIDGAGVLFGSTFVGFGSAHGITRAEVLSVGGTGGPLVMTEVSIVRGRTMMVAP